MDDNDRLPQGMRRLVGRCVQEAVQRHSSTVEAEHLLLALAADASNPVSVILTDAGLTYDALAAALEEERRRSLLVAGVAPMNEEMLNATPRRTKPTWGTSVTAARARDRRDPGGARRRRRPEIGVLIGVLQAEIGTVPRALAIAGVDRPALISSLQQASAFQAT